jgi:DNA modification methylase
MNYEIELWPITRFVPYARNPRKNDAVVDRMVGSIKEFGFKIPILARSHGLIVDGHLRLKAAERLGIAELPVILCDEWTEAQVKAFRLMANRSVAWAEWDEELLKLEFEDLEKADFDLDLTGFDETEMNRLLIPGTEGLTDPDAAPAIPQHPVSVLSDLWLLDPHRLLCGDATNAADLSRLLTSEKIEAVITDPPYNVGIEYGANVNDEKSVIEYLYWNIQWFEITKAVVRSCIILTPGIINMPMWIADIERTHRILAWVKENQCSRNYIGATSGFNIWEPILVYGKAKKCIARDSFSIPIHIQPDIGNHPCPKSIKAWHWLIDAFTDNADTIYDPFMGSGTTIIAAEQTGRICFGLEIEPAYVDVAVRRWQEFTGKQAVLEGTAKTFDEVRAEREKLTAETS